MTDSQVNVPMAPISTSKAVLLSEKRTLSYLPNRPPVTIEFSDLSYTIPQGRKGNKIILRSISGLFRSGQLTAILGPSGAGKSTLLNILAGYKSTEASGTILVNGQPRDITHFRKMSRYIMQDDLVQPHLTASEVMHYAADLKLGSEVSKMQKEAIVNEIMELLFLSKTRNTKTTQLSGGERKRLSIALELINNPPIIFLDEPTTGLDDLSSIQCVQLLKILAEGGRTVICSIHTPSAKIFSLFDHVYVLAAGFCIFQGTGMDIVPFLASIGLECPKHYNPADFVIEVSSGEYGDFLEKMVSTIDNGHCYYWSQHAASYTNDSKQDQSKSVTSDCSEKEADQSNIVTNDVPEEDPIYGFSSSCFEQFRILLYRMFLQMWRDTSYVCLQVIMYIFLIGTVGGLYYNMGYDGAKQIFNFGFCYTCIIVFLYIPMLPVLLYFPTEVRLLKREYFNHWYSLKAYYCALSISRVPPQLFLGTIYVCSVYWLSNQPLEWSRLLQFLTICHLIAFTSESLGFSISSRLSIVNGMFIGPVLSVPLMLFAVYGMGSGDSVPIHMRLLMCLSYLRFGFEGLMYAVYGNNRPMMVCPPEEDYCYFRSPKDLLVFTGMENSNIYVSVVALLTNIVILRALCYFILRWRLKPHNSFAALNYVGRIIKSHFNYAQQYK